MTRTLSWTLTLTVLAACLLATGLARAAQPPEINVEEDFLKPETVQKALAIARSVKEQYGKDLYIETFKSVPEGKINDVKAMSARRRARFFQEWAEEQALKRGVDGVYVLMCKQPPDAAIAVSPDLEERGFTGNRRSSLAGQYPKLWTSWNRDKNFLWALEKTRDELVRTLQAQPVPAETHTPVWLWTVYLACGVLGLWFVVGVIRALMGSAPPPTSKQGPGHVAASNGGVAGSVLGGMFGAAAGFWIYQLIFGPRPSEPAPPATRPVTAPPGIEELKRRAENLTAHPIPLTRPEDKTLSHHPALGEDGREV